MPTATDGNAVAWVYKCAYVVVVNANTHQKYNIWVRSWLKVKRTEEIFNFELIFSLNLLNKPRYMKLILVKKPKVETHY